MLLLITAWVACSVVMVWALLVAGRLRSGLWSRVAFGLALLTLIGLLVARMPLPRVEPADLGWLVVGSGALLGVWAVAVGWARRPVAPPRVDASRMRWVPRASHRPTWVIVAGLSTLLTLALFAVDRPFVGVLPWVVLAVAHKWAHDGRRGPLRVEARDVVLDGERIAIDELAPIEREVEFLGPVRRERLVVRHGDRRLHWLVTGSPADDVLAVLHLLHQQQQHAVSNVIQREPERLPPQWLFDVHEHGGRPVALGPDGESA